MENRTNIFQLKTSYLQKFSSKGCVFRVEKAKNYVFAARNDSEQPEAVKRYWKLEVWGVEKHKRKFSSV